MSLLTATAPPPAWRVGAAITPQAGPKAVVRWAWYVFIASLPFEYPGRTIDVEVTTLTAALFVLATAAQPRLCYGRMPGAVRWMVVFLYVFIAAYALGEGTYGAEVVRNVLTLTQLILLLWAAANVLRDESVVDRSLWILGGATFIRAALQFSGGGEAMDLGLVAGRQSAMGQNANLSATIMAVGLLSLAGLAYARSRPARWAALVFWPAAAVLATAVVQTGSRGGLVALGGGLLVLALGGRSGMARLRNVFASAMAIGLLIWSGAHSEPLRARIAQVEGGSLAGREAIYPAAWQMFRERPLLGWGPANNKYELVSRLPFPDDEHVRRDPHNLVLELLTTGGVIGAVPFLMAFGLCVAAAWRGRRDAFGVLPLALLATLFAANMANNFIVAKVFWVAMAIALAATPRRAEAPC